MSPVQLKCETKKPFSKTRSSETKPGFQNKGNTAQTTKTKVLKRARELKHYKTTLNKACKVKLTGSFLSVALLISGDLVVFVHFDLFFLLFCLLVYILINITNFLRDERFVYIFDGEKAMPIFGKNKVCMQMNAL